jgi:ATP-binding cassette subfamily B protein
VVLKESNDQTQGATGRPVFRLLKEYAWRYRWSYLAGAVFLWITNYLAVSIPGQIGHAIDALRVEQPMGRYVAAIAAMGVAVILVRSLSRVLIFNPGRHLEYHLRRDLFAHLLRLQPSFYATQKRGDIVSRASNDITWVRTLVGFGGLQIVNVTLAVILTGWKMVSLSPRLTLMVLLPILLGSGLVQWGIRRLFHLARRSQEQLGEISEHVLGSLQGMAAVQGFVAEEAFVERFEERNLSWFRTGMRLALIRSIALPLLVLSGGVAMFALIAVGGPMVLRGTLTVGELAAFTALLTVFLPPLRSMGWMMSVIQRGRAALERIFELMDAPLERPEGSDGVIPESGRGPVIELRDLHFAYPDEPLLRLLARLYNPPSESILIDGVDLLTLDLESWRRRMAVVPQRPFLFSDAIASNVALEAEPDDGHIQDVVEMAALGPDLEALPDGLGTVVGERGIMLSGGQRQRVALARGLYRGGDLLILDDVLSAVDHHTEAQLVETVADLARRPEAPTVLISSHRLSALRHCDMVLVLDGGRLVDSGPHAELIQRPGIYHDTWLVQSQRAAAEEEAAS